LVATLHGVSFIRTGPYVRGNDFADGLSDPAGAFADGYGRAAVSEGFRQAARCAPRDRRRFPCAGATGGFSFGFGGPAVA